MPAPIPEPRPEEDQPSRDGAAAAGRGGPGWAWVDGSADTGPVPEFGREGPQPQPPGPDGLPAGLDYAALLDGLAASGALGGDQDAELAEYLAAEEEGRLEPPDHAAVAAAAVEFMGPGAAQAGWLEVAAGGLGGLDENALAGVVIAARQAASRAQATELAAVAQITARAAQADPRIGVSADGRPGRVCRDAVAQIEFALKLGHYTAEAWADLAVTLTWRLPATGQALAGGRIDLDRAELIAAMTSVLTEAQARWVEARVLPAAGGLARGDLRERLARAVIAADPDGAERRREQAERNADVRLYADADQTATITGSKLPQVLAAAGFARLTALARARKAAGLAGGLGFHRAQVLLGMLLDTLPYIPPADGAPPDQPPPDNAPPDEPPPGGGNGPGPAGDQDPGGPGMADPNGPRPADSDGRRPGGGGGPGPADGDAGSSEADAHGRSRHDEGGRDEDVRDEDADDGGARHEDAENDSAGRDDAHEDVQDGDDARDDSGQDEHALAGDAQGGGGGHAENDSDDAHDDVQDDDDAHEDAKDDGTQGEDAQDSGAQDSGGPAGSAPDGGARHADPGNDSAHDDSAQDGARKQGTDDGAGRGERSRDDGLAGEDSRGEHPDNADPCDEGGWEDLPAPRDEDAPPDDGFDDRPGNDNSDGWDPAEDDDDLFATRPVPAWPALGVIPPGLAGRPAGAADGRPAPGLLDAVVPWTTLAGLSQTAGTLGRIGPVTAGQARQLAEAAEHDPGAQWRVIVTNDAGQAIAVARIRRPRHRCRAARDGTGPPRHSAAACRDGPLPAGAGLVGRITVTITQDTLTAARSQASGRRRSRRGPPSVVDAALRAAGRALDQAVEQEAADAAAGGCAHADQSPGYRPQPRLREYVTARDVTCRSPVCRQPAWRADLDHTRPYDQHGPTCRCNLGGGCRRDHQLKQHPRWTLEQVRPGWFRWTAPSGRTYTVGPDIYPV